MKILSIRFVRISSLAAALFCAIQSASGFALLGPYAEWQTTEIGYRLPGDIGGPMDLNEGYRWNTPVITYGFDPSFVNYFGTNGIAAVEKAIAILNNLPPAFLMSSNLEEFPTSSKGIHYLAASLKLYDLKSVTLHYLLEQLGLADPVRFTWTLRSRQVYSCPLFLGDTIIATNTYTNYLVIQRNLDPITQCPTNSINENSYGYWIMEPLLPFNHADAIEHFMDPLFQYDGSAVGGLNLNFGEIYYGLTRDDAGGLCYLYSGHPQVESLLPLTWGAGPNADYYFDRALRPGVQKLNFLRMETNSFDGRFTPLVVEYTDWVMWNGVSYGQTVQRFIDFPDILFSAANLGGPTLFTPFQAIFPLVDRPAGTTNWANNATFSGTYGPGVIRPPVSLVFNTGLPGVTECAWGSFDTSTEFPLVFSHVGPRLATTQFNQADHSVHLTIQKLIPGSTNVLETSTDLAAWNPISTNLAFSTTWDFIDYSTNETQKFYRIKSTR